MTVYSWLWIAWIAAFLAVEIPAALTNDSRTHPQSLSQNIWWLIRGRGPWHYTARIGLVFLLAWLSLHLLSGGTFL